MVYVAAAQLVLIVGLIRLLDRNHKAEVQTIYALISDQDQERQQTLALFADLNAAAASRDPHPDLTEMVGIVDRLCQRVQAPMAAVTEHSMAQPLPPMPQPALPDDDAQGWRNLGFDLSKEDLAVALDG